MKKFILSIDQGTTGTTALLTDSVSFELLDKCNEEFKQIFPTPGWVEHNLDDIWQSTKSVVSKVLKKNSIGPNQIISIGITNQRETTCAYTKDGKPLANAIVWQDRRTSDFCKVNKENYTKLQSLTGLPLDPYFSGTKMKWLLENSPEVKKEASQNNLRLSTIDTFLLYKLTNGNSFATDASNASRTLLMDLETTNWSNKLLEFFSIDPSFLPEIKDSFTDFGMTEGLDFLPDGIPINCILGDQQAALFGQTGYKKGDLKCTYGTGAFILLNTGEEKTYSKNGLLTTVAYKNQGQACYALEGSSYIAGAAVQWLRDKLKIIKSSPDIESLALKVEDLKEMEHLLFLPFFTGIASPYWNATAKAAIIGMTRDTDDSHLSRACLDGIALSINDSITALINDIDSHVTSIKVDGGASQNDLLMKIQASFSNKKIIRPKVIETTGYGVALGAAVGLGIIKMEEMDKLWKEDKVFSPDEDHYYSSKKEQWEQTIKRIY